MQKGLLWTGQAVTGFKANASVRIVFNRARQSIALLVGLLNRSLSSSENVSVHHICPSSCFSCLKRTDFQKFTTNLAFLSACFDT